MPLSLRSMVSFSALIASSGLMLGLAAARPLPIGAEPVVTPGSRLRAGPEDCALPALLVPGGGEPVRFCAGATLAAASRTSMVSAAVPETLVIGQSPFMIHRRNIDPT